MHITLRATDLKDIKRLATDTVEHLKADSRETVEPIRVVFEPYAANWQARSVSQERLMASRFRLLKIAKTDGKIDIFIEGCASFIQPPASEPDMYTWVSRLQKELLP